MKRIALTMALAAALFATAASAHGVIVVNDPYYRGRNMLLVNPGDLLNGVVSLEYERALTSYFGLTGGFSAAAFNGPFNFGQPAYTVIGPEFGMRFHFIEAAPAGLWLGPTISAGYVVARDGSLVAVSRAWSWGLGAAVGYNFVFGRHFTLQVGAGGGFQDYGDVLVWTPRLRLGLGATF
ncbi:MAG: hypothetical protein QM817_10645 [Archangium sp.]